ncbi:G -coupled receptor GPR1 [Hyphodiscus hymeniophilus]|uniref:G -coupled receptor GPR1 n=1 Tax=Hyphodiscus hymeniophilus TaxID=353542 RepID=A0A9P7B0T2_9HELO|nr:G -coupled receptor GPR1 [Hyphodiscus hymeniophilus]
MAPLSNRIARAMWDFEVELRSRGSENSTKIGEHFSPSEENALQCLALVFSSISVASAILAFYCLIMLLIQSDMFKALWFLIYPAVVFVHGPIPNDSTFCQVTGFFLVVGIEASGTQILLDYTLGPKEAGLYPYRHLAYVIWVFFPLTMASLAFSNDTRAYVDQATYCYLPVRPLWYSLVLSWIPRYVIFLAILGIYASIYYYVRSKFHGFDKESKSRRTSIHTSNAIKGQKAHALPPTPTLACHGLISEPSGHSVATVAEARKQSVSSLGSEHGAPLAPTGTTRFIWASVLATNDSASDAPPSEDLSTVDSNSFTGPSTSEPLPAYLGTSLSSPNNIEVVNGSQSRTTAWPDNFVSRVAFSPSQSQLPKSKYSTAEILSSFRRGSLDLSNTTQPVPPQLQLINSRGQNMAVSEMLRTREKIRRQLRLLFIYPLVYMAMWVVPFVSDILQYDDRMAVNPPFALTCVTTIFMCCQAAVDCWLFSTREKPWRHIHGSDESFWGSLKFWSGWSGVRRKKTSFGPGKTRDEMVRDSRAAYQRREEELAQRRIDVIRGDQAREQRRERSWWEAAGFDGTIASQEESVNPEDNETESSGSPNDGKGSPGLPSSEVSEEKDQTEEETTTQSAHDLSETEKSST